MASKKTQIDIPLVGTSGVDPTLDSNFDIPYTGPMTRGRIKALAEVYAQTTTIPQSSSVFNTSETEKSQTASSTQGASKDVASLVKEMLSQPALSPEPTHEAPIVEEEDESFDGFEFYFSENIPTSKLRESPHSVSSSTMLVMMTNTNIFGGTSLNYSPYFRRANKVHERKGSIERHTNNFLDG